MENLPLVPVTGDGAENCWVRWSLNSIGNRVSSYIGCEVVGGLQGVLIRDGSLLQASDLTVSYVSKVGVEVTGKGAPLSC